MAHPTGLEKVPAVGFGPLCGSLSQNGATDEWVDVGDDLRAAEIGARLIAAWCQAG